MKDELENLISELEELSVQYPEQAKREALVLLNTTHINLSLKIRCLHIIANSWRTRNSFQNAALKLKEVDDLINNLNQNEYAEIITSHYIEWARLYKRFHKYKEAIHFLNLAKSLAYKNKLEPIAHTALAILADIKFDMQDIEGAWEILTELIDKESQDPDSIMLATFQVKLAEIYMYCNAYKQAKQLLTSAANNALEEDQLFILVTRLDFALTENDLLELQKLTQYLENHRYLLDDPEVLYLAIASWNQLKEFPKAEEAIKKLESHYLKSGHWHNLSYLYSGALEIYRSSGKFDEGKDFFKKALQIVGESPQDSIMWLLHNSYGRLLWDSNSNKEAIINFNKAIEYLEHYRMSIPEDYSRIEFFADKVYSTLNYVDFSIEQKAFTHALYFLESSKSLSLLDQLEMDSQTKTLGFHKLKSII